MARDETRTCWATLQEKSDVAARSAGNAAAHFLPADADGSVISQVAIALILVIGAGLLLRSFVKFSWVNPGFRTSNVVALHVVLPGVRRYTGGHAQETPVLCGPAAADARPAGVPVR